MTSTNTLSDSTHSIRFRTASPTDGASLWQLVRATGTLEVNSAYAYVLLATDFGDTCLMAEQDDGQTIGAVLGYHPPREPGTAFVWQVGVHPQQQGRGLGLQLLLRWLALPANAHCRWVTATVANDNLASQALFHRLAREYSCPCSVKPHFTADLFPVGHAAEPLFRIGPIDRGTPARDLQGQHQFPVPA
jgi:L-2,4-diaminobutyric acid acetyltransferase